MIRGIDGADSTLSITNEQKVWIVDNPPGPQDANLGKLWVGLVDFKGVQGAQKHVFFVEKGG